MNMLIFWGAAAAVFLVIEFITVGMSSIWCVVGALAALLAAALGGAVWVQIFLFLLVTGLCFVLLYPKLKRFVRRGVQPTNADMVIGKTCVVTQTIDNLSGAGAVSIGGKTWTARSESGERIAEGNLVCVKAIEGVKLIVTPARVTSTVS